MRLIAGGVNLVSVAARCAVRRMRLVLGEFCLVCCMVCCVARRRLSA